MDLRIDGFRFFRSYWDAILEMDEPVQLEVLKAIAAYGLDGTEPELLSPISRAIFSAIRPNLDSSRESSINGKSGGRPPKKAPFSEKEKPPFIFSESKRREKEMEIEKGSEYEEEEKSIAVSAYLEKVSPSLSSQSQGDLSNFEDQLGTEVCLHAFDVALDNGKNSWSYIKAILQRWSTAGVKCLADVEALEVQHERGKIGQNQNAGATRPQPGKPGDGDRLAREDMEQLRRMMKEGKLWDG